MNISPRKEELLAELKKSLDNESFIKISLGNYQGDEKELKKVQVKPVLIKKTPHLSFTYKYKTKDIVKNYAVRDGAEKIRDLLNSGFLLSILSTLNEDIIFENKKGKESLKHQKIPGRSLPNLSHDKNKKRLIETGKPYLSDLKITDKDGTVLKTAQDKFRQINRYIELLEPLIKAMPDRKISIADMGSGKGYLTFALYDFLKSSGLDVDVKGIECRPDMVDLCNQIAAKSKFGDLSFLQGSIESFKSDAIDVIIALHACDTATDDAIFKGIQSNAELIVVAPCCHKQIRREMECASDRRDFEFLTRHGIFMERQAEMVTDGLRALMLEYCGYKVKVFEFISGEHTAKNVMITAMREKKSQKDRKILKRIHDAMNYFGIKSHHLGRLLDI